MTKMSTFAAPHGCRCSCLMLLLVFILFNLLVRLEYAEGKQTAYACEGSTLRLDCEHGRIHVIRAIFGRFSITICNENGYTDWSVNCGGPKSGMSVINGTCNNQKSCQIMASTESFGDPCPGTRKYLEVQYQCNINTATSMTSTTPRSSVKPGHLTPWLGPSSSSKDSNINTKSTDRGGSGSAIGSGSGSVVTTPSKGLIGVDVPLFPYGALPPVTNNNNNNNVNNVNNNQSSSSSNRLSTPDFYVTTVKPVLYPNNINNFNNFNSNNNSTSTSTVLVNPLMPPSSSSSSSESDELDDIMKDNIGIGIGGGLKRPGLGIGMGFENNEYKWRGEIGEPTESWGWDAQVEKQKQQDSDTGSSISSSGSGNSNSGNGVGVGSGSENMWSDKMAENGGGLIDKDEDEEDEDGDRDRDRIVTHDPITPTQNIHPHLNPYDVGSSSSSSRGGNEMKAHPGREMFEFCEATTERGMFWNWTIVGDTISQPCPGGAAGLARWKCVRNNQNPTWYPDQPDLSDCKSAWLLSLSARLFEGERISSIASDLSQVTSTKPMYGGDLSMSIKIIKMVATRMNDQLGSLTNQVSREDLAAEVLQLILDSGSNLLEKGRLDPWRDLSYPDQMSLATALLVGLEDNSFLLANTITQEKILRKSAKNILTTIYAIEANNVREINFPLESGTDQWGRMGDTLSLPADSLRENSDGGLVRLVGFSFRNLEHVLQPRPTEGKATKLVNSRVISASLNKGRHIQLNAPVQLTLRHLILDNVSNPSCVFWDYTLNAWSEEGCRVVKSNRTHTHCMCTHLTNFAILMDLQPPPEHLAPPQLQIVSLLCSAVVIMCLVFTFIITHFCIHGKVFQTLILKNLFVSMLIGEIIYVFGIHQTDNPYLCTGIAALLHFFGLVSIVWLFLHGFHLHLIVVEKAESGVSRKLWYYGVSYGSPAIVVLLSFLLDPHSYRSEKSCWIQTSFTLLCFVGPAVVVALAAAAVLLYTSYKVCALLSAMPKQKPNDDKTLYTYAGTWLRGSLLILVLMIVTWTLRLLDLESDSLPLSYAASFSLAIEGIVILLFISLKSDDIISKLCDCTKSSDRGDTEMSTHSQQQLQGMPGTNSSLGIEACHNHLTQQRMVDTSRLHLQPDMRNQSIYSKQLGTLGTMGTMGVHPSPGGISGHNRYQVDTSGILGLYSKGGMDGNWPRGSSYSDIRSVLKQDPVYAEIGDATLSPRASISSDLSEDDGHGLYPHDVEIYTRSICGQRRMNDHYHHHMHMHGTKGRKVEMIQGGEQANPLLQNRSQHLVQSHYMTKHRTPTTDHHHHVSLNGDDHILQNVHMV